MLMSCNVCLGSLKYVWCVRWCSLSAIFRHESETTPHSLALTLVISMHFILYVEVQRACMHMHGGMDACRHACMRAWTHAGTAACRQGCMQAWLHAGMAACRHGCMQAWTRACMDAFDGDVHNAFLFLCGFSLSDLSHLPFGRNQANAMVHRNLCRVHDNVDR